jgi:hypothetical protein
MEKLLRDAALAATPASERRPEDNTRGDRRGHGSPYEGDGERAIGHQQLAISRFSFLPTDRLTD